MQPRKNPEPHINNNQRNSSLEKEHESTRISKRPPDIDRKKKKDAIELEEKSKKELDEISRQTDDPERSKISREDYN